MWERVRKYLASAEAVRHPDLRLATWDRRLWMAASTLGIEVLPRDRALTEHNVGEGSYELELC